MGSSKIQAAPAGNKKILVLGGLAVGKTSLIQKYISSNQSITIDTFVHEYQQTFGADLFIKTSSEPAKPSLNIWVLAGHERYRPLMQQFYQNTTVIIF
jgi:GTPase SAR1 family protein